MKTVAHKALILSIILIFTAVLPVPANAAASAPSNYEKAIDLKILGLLANPPAKFELERAPTRVEGVIMLIRLLGKEKLAKQSNYQHPFTDVPSWASYYVGYMYHNNLTKGIGNNMFGSDDSLTARQYVTFVLRSIGYEDKVDFEYDRAFDKAQQIGLMDAAERSAYEKAPDFLRNDMVGISYDALSIKLKTSDQTLLDKLVLTDKAVYQPAARVLGLYTSDVKYELTNITSFNPAVTQLGSVVKNSEELFLLLRKALYYNENLIKIDAGSYNGKITTDFEAAYDRAVAVVSEVTGVDDFIDSWNYVLENHAFEISIRYRFGKDTFEQRKKDAKAALNKARELVATLIMGDMTEYSKEMILHDYIIYNTRYDYENYRKGTIPSESFEEYGCLVLGVAVCEGYSEAMKLLCDLSSIECLFVSGKSKSGNDWIDHAWNIVKIDGKYYHVDVTNDDPVSQDGKDVLAYYYFNLPDSEMALGNTWEKADYPACTNNESNYYVKNDMVVANRQEFEQRLQKAVEQRKSGIELKVSDFSKAEYSNMSEIVFKNEAVSKFNYVMHDTLGIIRIYNIEYW